MRLFGRQSSADTQRMDEAKRARQASEAGRAGLQCLKENNPRQAVVELRRCVELNPQDVDAYGYLGRALQQLGDLAAANEALQAAIGLAPVDERLRRAHGQILEALSRLDEAAEEYEVAASLDFENAPAHAALGALALRRGNLPGARFHLMTACKLNHAAAQAHADLAEVCRQEGDKPAALEAIGAALRLAPKNPSFQYQLGLLLEENEDLTAALKALRAGLEGQPASPDLLFALGRVLMKLGRDAEVLPLYERAIKADPSKHERFDADLRRLVAEYTASRTPRLVPLPPAAPGEMRQPSEEVRRIVAGSMPMQRNHSADTPTPTAPVARPLPPGEAGAVAELLAELQADPNNSRLHRKLSLIYMRIGWLAEAREHAQLAESLRAQRSVG